MRNSSEGQVKKKRNISLKGVEKFVRGSSQIKDEYFSKRGWEIRRRVKINFSLKEAEKSSESNGKFYQKYDNEIDMVTEINTGNCSFSHQDIIFRSLRTPLIKNLMKGLWNSLNDNLFFISIYYNIVNFLMKFISNIS